MCIRDSTITNYSPRAVCLSPGFSLVAASAQRGRGGGKVHCVMLSLFYDMVIIKVINNKSAAEFIFVRVRVTGRDPFNQTFGKFRSKTQSIGSVQPEKFRKKWVLLLRWTFALLRLFSCLVYISTYCVPIAHLRQNKPFPLLYLGHAQITRHKCLK